MSLAGKRERKGNNPHWDSFVAAFAFKVTFKENILVLTRIYLLYSCIWLLAWVPNRQRSGPAQFKAKTCNEKRFFFFFLFSFFIKQVFSW